MVIFGRFAIFNVITIPGSFDGRGHIKDLQLCSLTSCTFSLILNTTYCKISIKLKIILVKQGDMTLPLQEYLAYQILQKLHVLYDCIDGLEHIISDSSSFPEQHAKIYKKYYNKFFNYVQDTVKAIRELTQIDGTIKHDETISSFYQDVCQISTKLLSKYKIAEEGAIAARIIGMPSLVESSHQAKYQYKKYLPILDEVISFYGEYEAELKECYLKNFKEKLLSHQSPFTKRHEIMELFSVITISA